VPSESPLIFPYPLFPLFKGVSQLVEDDKQERREKDRITVMWKLNISKERISHLGHGLSTEKAHPGTGEWLKSGEAFKKFKLGDIRHIWINGIRK